MKEDKNISWMNKEWTNERRTNKEYCRKWQLREYMDDKGYISKQQQYQYGFYSR